MNHQYLIDIHLFNMETEPKSGIDIVLLSFIKFGIEISQGVHPNKYDTILFNFGIWKLYFAFQIMLDWR